MKRKKRQKRFDYRRLEVEKAMSRGELIVLYRRVRDAADGFRSGKLAEQYRKAAEQMRMRHALTQDEIDGQLPLL